jgi:hypothetical protein
MQNMNNNYNIINEYNINYNNISYNLNRYDNFNVIMRHNVNQMYDNSEEFIREQEHLIQIQEYENELRREQELRIQNLEIEEEIRQQREITHVFINEILWVTQQIISHEEQENLISEIEHDEEINNEMINTYLINGEKLIETCSICIDDVTDIKTTSMLSCGHHFHTNCIRLCLERNNKCPLCRKNCMRNI